MRIILKIIAAPFVILLTISWAIMVFLFCWAEVILKFLSGIAVLIAIIMLLAGQTQGGIVFGVIAFLVSPIGIPAVAKWLIDKIDDLSVALKSFITT
jgi:hypothetical protein